MKWVHLIFGFVLFVVFTQTGQYMRADFPDKEVIPQDFRILMRSRHIYILFSALIHISLGVYLELRGGAARKLLQYSGSIVLFASSVLLVWAFVVETYSTQHVSNISGYGIYASLAGVILHVLGGTSRNRER